MVSLSINNLFLNEVELYIILKLIIIFLKCMIYNELQNCLYEKQKTTACRKH